MNNYYAILADIILKDLLSYARVDLGLGTSVPNLRRQNMTDVVEIFVTESHPLWAGLETAHAAGHINDSYKLNATNDDIEAR